MASTDHSIYDILNKEEFCHRYITNIMNNCNNTDSDAKCWLWTKSQNGGYGHKSYSFKILSNGSIKSVKHYTKAHRLMFAVYFNQLYILHPENQFVQCSHLCHNTLCCNPQHLRLENSTQNGSRTTCKNNPTAKKCTHQPPCLL